MNRVLLLWVMMVLTCLAGVALAGGLSGGLNGLNADQYRLWERHWRLYAQRCAVFENDYLCCPGYDRRYPSGLGMTVRQAEAELSEKIKVRGGGMVVTKTLKMPVAEAQALANPLPKLAVGQYGFLASVQIKEVLGPTSMLVKNLELIDRSRLRQDYRDDRDKARRALDSDAAQAELQRVYKHRDELAERQKLKPYRALMRLEGFETEGLTQGARWLGPGGEGLQIVIAKQETYGPKRRPRHRLVAVSLSAVRWGLDEPGFVRLLELRSLDRAGFVQRVLDKMAKHDPQTAQQRVFMALLPALENVTRVEPGTAGEEAEAGR